MSNTVAVAKFLRGYRAFAAQRRKARMSGISGFLKRFKSDLNDLHGRIREEERRCAHRFNIFEALGIERKEELLHTQLLAHLLNPEAAHGQGCVFLDNFFGVAREHQDFKPPLMPIDKLAWRVRPEVPVENGQLDLLIECAWPPYVLVIENKVDAGEQPRQLQRYSEWMKTHRKSYERQLIFLTPEGRDSVSSGGAPYIRMSYKKDIAEFLKRSFDQVKALPVRNVLRQYLAVVKDLKGDTDDERSVRQ